ncbi:hypothetical protein BgiBS90_002108 [Biomphalaria glabrata]|nr:hypothetical protein BgiBS90_002108 [Biomphalaria glabrata]
MEEGKSSTRGRKRKTDDSNLSPEEQEKKKKNRDAAKKCREKKEKEAQELKQRNAELESENSTLSKEKIKLLDKIKEFKTIIQIHMDKGCSLPPDIEMLFQEGSLDDFREVGYIETRVDSRMHTPPHTPDSSSSDQHSSPMPFKPNDPAPTALFSGTPLRKEVCSKKNIVPSRSPSRSPGPQGATFFQTQTETRELSHILLNSKSLPPVLNPIQVSLSKIPTNITRSTPFPTVVIDDDDDDDVQVCNDVTDVSFKPHTQETLPSQKLHWVPVSEQPGSSSVLNKAFEHPDIPSEDVIAKQLFAKDDSHYFNQPYESLRNSSFGSENQTENLKSLGFNSSVQSLPEGYSYTEDLAEVVLPDSISDFTNATVQYVSQEIESQTESDIQITNSQENAATIHEFELGVLSSAILALGPGVSDQLQEQIKKQYPITDQQLGQPHHYMETTSQTNVISRPQQAIPESHEKYMTVIDSNEITTLNSRNMNKISPQTIAQPQASVQKYNNGQSIITVDELSSAKLIRLPDGKILIFHSGTVVNQPVLRAEQATQNIEQDQQSSILELNLPSLNFEDLQQNGNIFDKTKSKSSSSS